MTAKVLEEFKEALEYYKSGRVKTFRGAFSYMNVKHYYDGPIIGGVDLSKLLPETQRPTYRQFYYYCHKNLTKKDKDIIKTSKQEQRNNKRLLLSDSLKGVEGPGDLVEIDACEIDVSLVAETNREQCVGRPIVYAMLDVYTRSIIAVSIAFDNNSNLALTNLFLNLGDDKVKYCKRYGIDITSDMWKSNIIPNRIRCDRGCDFKSKEFEKICNRLVIQRELVSGGSGSLKGSIEQIFRQIHLAQNLVLENYGMIEKRHDSNHHRESTLTLSEYIPILLNYILKHNQEYMSTYKCTKEMIKLGIKPIPSNIWDYGCEKYGSPRPIVDRYQYMYDLMIEKKGVLTRKGIVFNGLYYINIDDKELLNDMIKVENKRIPFRLRYDPRSVDCIYYVRNSKLYIANLNEDMTSNLDYLGMTFKELEDFKKKKRRWTS